MRWFADLMLLLGLLVVFVIDSQLATAEIRTDFAADSDPKLIVPNPVKRFSKKFKPLWLEALARPESDLQRLAAETIAQAHVIGVPEMIDARELLLRVVSAEKSHLTARIAAARALIVLDAKDAGQSLFDASMRYGADLRQVIEPALADWKFEPIRAIWLQRLDAKETRHRELMLAIHGLGKAGDESALPKLLGLTSDRQRPSSVRLAAARSAGLLKDSGLDADAKQLIGADSSSTTDRLVAVALLGRHQSAAAQSLLLQLARDQEPSVVAAALARLNAISHDLVLPLAEQAIANDDVNVREQGANAFVARPTPGRMMLLAKLLDDVHPSLRGSIRESLFVLAQNPDLDAVIRPAATQVLESESWRGQEQAALLLCELDHKPAAPRLVKLLESSRSEVLVTAAWGLRKLAVPEMLPAMLERATQQTEVRLKGRLPHGVDEQVAHLFEAFGIMKYAASEALLRKYVPKILDLGEYSRSAAIWSLGLLHNGVPDEQLATQLVERLTEPLLVPSEFTRVRTMSAISLGRMQAKSQVKRMLDFLGPKVSPFATPLAIRWAVHQLTGELLPDAEPPIESRSGWFLEPLDDD